MLITTIKNRRDFLRISHPGNKNNIKKHHSKNIIIIKGKIPEEYLLKTRKLENINDDFCRIGYIITKKIGNAVIRNKIKRRFRHIIRDIIKNDQKLMKKDHDYIIIAKKSINSIDFSDIERDIKYCLKNLG
jgi:ribonuclease P protein component